MMEVQLGADTLISLTSHTKVLSGGVVCDRFSVFLHLSLLAKHSYLVTEAPPKIGVLGGVNSHTFFVTKRQKKLLE